MDNKTIFVFKGVLFDNQKRVLIDNRKEEIDYELQKLCKALTQNKALVEYEAVKKWDGKLPEYMMGGAMPFINLAAKK